MKTPRLTPEWDRTCPHVNDEAGRSYVCAGCAKDILAARDAEHSRRTEPARAFVARCLAALRVECPDNQPDDCSACGKDAEDCETDGSCFGGIARANARAALEALGEK